MYHKQLKNGYAKYVISNMNPRNKRMRYNTPIRTKTTTKSPSMEGMPEQKNRKIYDRTDWRPQSIQIRTNDTITIRNNNTK